MPHFFCTHTHTRTSVRFCQFIDFDDFHNRGQRKRLALRRPAFARQRRHLCGALPLCIEQSRLEWDLMGWNHIESMMQIYADTPIVLLVHKLRTQSWYNSELTSGILSIMFGMEKSANRLFKVLCACFNYCGTGGCIAANSMPAFADGSIEND